MPETQDPVHFDNGSWWFWNETWSERHGPYASETEARTAVNAYAKEFLMERIVDPEEEHV
jgi:hypothetical protein